MDVELVIGAFLVLLLLTLGGILVWASVRVVREYQRLIVFRLGRSIGARGPGLVLLIPGVDRGVRVDLREQFIQVPHQTCITRDNAPVNVDCLVYMHVVDSIDSVVQVQNYHGAAQGIAMTTLRSVVGDLSLDDVLAKREEINTLLRAKLDEVTERWGVKVNSVEIREIIPPREVQDAMNRQLSAERTRRAVIIESEGSRQSAINVAEGQKQSEILKAEGERQAAILRAEGFSQALERIFAAAHVVDQKTMALQYLEALKALGASPSTKFVIPTEFTRLIEPIAGYVERGMAADQASSSAAPRRGRPSGGRS
jgi:regulator of protease activity HflC (stomatin/prohibitin superfamily)